MNVAPYPLVPHLWSQPTADQKYFKKIPEGPQKQNLNLLCASNYLRSIYIVFTTVSIVLGIISNLEMTKYMGGWA